MNVMNISISASLLILIIIAMRAFFIHRLQKKAFLVLWFLALSRLLLPFSIPSPFNIGNIIEALHVPLYNEAASNVSTPLFIDALGDTITQTTPVHAAEAVSAETLTIDLNSGAKSAAGAIALMPWYFWLWLAGFMTCALFFIITHLRCRSIYRTALPVDNSFVQNWINAHSLQRKVLVRQSDKVAAPLAYSIWWPVILLPKDTNWQDKAQLSYILTHEYEHVKNFDAAWKWLLAAALSIYWFNPLVWIMYVLANRDLELSCDEAVLYQHGESSKPGYALTLISLAEKRKALTPLVNNFSKNFVEERIVAIMKMKKTTTVSMLAALVMVVGIALVFATDKAAPIALAANNGGNSSQVKSESAPKDPVLYSNYITVDNLDYVERMLFVTKGECNLKTTCDGKTWSSYTPILEEEYWSWYTYEEYRSIIEYIKEAKLSAAINSFYLLSLIAMNKDVQKLEQTLADIQNGIKVSKYKPVYLMNGEGPLFEVTGVNSKDSAQTSWIMWYCFGYSFTDKAGNEVDLGLFETRSELFSALKQYYNDEVAAGRMTPAEADTLYKKIAHPIRNADEAPLQEKILNYSKYSINCTMSSHD